MALTSISSRELQLNLLGLTTHHHEAQFVPERLSAAVGIWGTSIRRGPSAVCATSTLPPVPAEIPETEIADDGEPASLGLYTPLMDFVEETLRARGDLMDYPFDDKFRAIVGTPSTPGSTAGISRSRAYQTSKLRFLRCADISAGSLHVLNFVAFPRIEYPLPIFCADLITLPRGHLVVLDVNPLSNEQKHLDSFVPQFMPLYRQHAESLPWGGEMTSEAMEFFSPALVWSRLPPDTDVKHIVFPAFKEYFMKWLELVDACEPCTKEGDREWLRRCQHRYMAWRTEKDPGRPTLTRLFGTERCEEYIHDFLFEGVNTMGSETFLDYFPQYRADDGSVLKQRSIQGRSFSHRPWDDAGNRLDEAECAA